MITFSATISIREGYHNWGGLMRFLSDAKPSYHPYLNTTANNIRMVKRMGDQCGFRVVDNVWINHELTLVFDDPQKELMFKLKYL